MNTGSTDHPGDGGGSTVITAYVATMPAGTTYDLAYDITDTGGPVYGSTTGTLYGITLPYTLAPACGFGPAFPSGKLLLTANFLGKEIGHGTYSGEFAS
jgi:hypothetical protein